MYSTSSPYQYFTGGHDWSEKKSTSREETLPCSLGGKYSGLLLEGTLGISARLKVQCIIYVREKSRKLWQNDLCRTQTFQSIQSLPPPCPSFVTHGPGSMGCSWAILVFIVKAVMDAPGRHKQGPSIPLQYILTLYYITVTASHTDCFV